MSQIVQEHNERKTRTEKMRDTENQSRRSIVQLVRKENIQKRKDIIIFK